MNRKKGQAALEFLTTYGWAFLVILVMISALAYFGVLDPSRFVSDRCIMGSPLTCDANQFILRADNASFSARNGLSDGVVFMNFTYSTSINQNVQCTNFNASDIGNWTINPNSQRTFTCAFESADKEHLENAGGKERVQFIITHRNVQDTAEQFVKTLEGEIYSSVEN